MLVEGRCYGMQLKAKDEAVLRRYLLGDVSSQEQEEVDLWLMSSEDAYDLLEAAEDDLIDDALAGRLQKRDLDRFNTVFLVAPERQRKLQFSRSLRRAVDAANPATEPVAASSEANVWQQLREIFSYRPVVAYGMSALSLILLIATTWSAVQVAELQRQLRSTSDQLVTIGRDRDDLRKQLEESREATRTLEAQVRELESSPKTSTPSAGPVLLAVNLIPGITRSANDISTITLTANTRTAQFSLALLDDNFASYRASLTKDGREILSRDKISANSTPDGKTIQLTVPAENLSDGDYSFLLSGIPTSGAPESVARYYFRVSHR